MSVPIIHHENDFLSIGVHDIHQILDFLCPVHGCAAHMVHTPKWFHKGKDSDSAFAGYIPNPFFGRFKESSARNF